MFESLRRPLVRRLPVGAEWSPARGTHFRVWAPSCREVELVLEDAAGRPRETLRLAPEPGGYFSALAPAARPGALYRYRLDGEGPFPDPASRFQPSGPHGPSRVVDPAAYSWRTRGWGGLRREGLVLYELHAGTFTPEGTWAAAGDRLAELAELGIGAVELMPVADFPGRFGWGYDGVCLYAPTRLYGEPDELRRFVDRAHGEGLGVILDVVYNHLGPAGNYLGRYARAYQSGKPTEWGPALNFDGDGSAGVREFFVSNAAYWIDEYRFDGLRLDATQSIFDESRVHVVSELGRAARAAAAGRSIVIVAENEAQEARFARPVARGGLGLDGVWNDDFHHAARVALTGEREAYYCGFTGSAQELLSAVLRGYLYQGNWYGWQKKRRGSPAWDLPPAAFVHYLDNHDQASNSLEGRRLHALCEPARHRALTALLLLGPQTPMLFQGQEFGSRAPFTFFADHEPRLAEAVRKGRREFVSQFPSVAAASEGVPDPGAESTFLACKLDRSQADPAALDLHRDLLRLRREDPAIAAQSVPLGAVLGPRALALRWGAGAPEDRLLVLNLDAALDLSDRAEPLLAEPAPSRWTPLWSSERPEYGGRGAADPVDARGRWRIPAHCAVLLRPA
jgi:maltooligosyltrehalose trehalohydrolase